MLLLSLWLPQLPSKVPLDLEYGLVLVDSELLEQAVVVLVEEALHNLELHHVVVMAGILGLGVADLGTWNRSKLLVKLLHPLDQARVGALVVDSDKSPRLRVVGDEFISETKSCTTLGLDPLWHVWSVCRLRDAWGGKLLVWLGEESLWLKREHGGVTLLGLSAYLSMQLVAPLHSAIFIIRWELEDSLSRLEVGDDRALVLTRAHDQAGIGETPGEREDAAVVNVVEGSYRVVWLPEIPDVDRRVQVIIVGDNELGGDLWVPHHLRLLTWEVLATQLVLGSKVVVDSCCARWLGEREDGLVDLQVPDHDLAVFTRARQDVRDDSVPADGRDPRSLVIVGHSWLEDAWGLQVG